MPGMRPLPGMPGPLQKLAAAVSKLHVGITLSHLPKAQVFCNFMEYLSFQGCFG